MKRPKPVLRKKDTKEISRPGAPLSTLLRTGRFRFVAAFSLSCLGLWALVCALPDSFAKAVCEHTARILGDVLNAFGYPVSVAGNVVADSGISFQIVLECTALSVVAIFACFVSSYRTQGRKKLLGLAMGIPALYLGNLVRLVSIFVVTRHDPSLFEIIHVYMGQVFTLILVALGCIVWLKWVDRDPSAGPVVRIAGFFARLVVISGCMFLFWMEVHHGYVWLLDRLMIFGFSLFNYQLFIPRETAVYYETFSIVAFTSLVLATGSTSWPSKAKGLAIGLGLFVLLHLFHRTNNALVSAFHFTSLLQLDIFLCDVGQYLLPIVLWVLVAAGRLPRKTKSPDPLSSHGQRVEHVAVK